MADGKRYKNDEVKKMDRDEEELQKQYQAMLKEIEIKKQNDKIAEKEKEDLLKGNEDFENSEPIKLLDINEAIESIKAIKEIKEEIMESKEQILEQEEIVILSSQDNVVKDNIIKDNVVKELNKEIDKELDKELDKEILFNIDDLDLDNEEKMIAKIKDKNNIEENIKEIKKDKKTSKEQSNILKVLKVIGNILYYIAFIFILAVLLMVVVQRFSNNEIALGGFRMFNILTGSMEPEYNIGDVLISKTVNPEDIEIGDDLVYKGEEKPFKDLIVTHRVVDLNKEEDGTYSFITRGIANDVDDPIITESQIYGKIIYKVRSFSILSKAINNMYVFFFVIFIPIAILVAIKVIQVKNEKIEDYEE